MLKTELKLGVCIKHKQTGLVYRIAKRKRKSNKRSGWHLFILHKIDNPNMSSYLKYRLIRKYFTIDRTAQVLYSK